MDWVRPERWRAEMGLTRDSTPPAPHEGSAGFPTLVPLPPLYLHHGHVNMSGSSSQR
jgi:hypothetical protein